MQQLIVTGTLGRDAEKRSAGGSDVTTFSVAVEQGWGQNKQTNWFRCNLWGSRGDKLAQYLTKGAKVTVVGELKIGEYQGKPQYEVNVSDVALQGGGQSGQREQPRQQPKQDAFGDEPLDDDVPF